MINRTILTFLAVLLAAGTFAAELTGEQRAAIEARIKPVGESCLEGDNSCGGAPAGAVASGAPRSGEEVYNAACLACHSTGAAGAPKYADAEAWSDRIAQGIDVLYAHAIDGMPGTGMMAKGGCTSCSDEEIKAAVDYMVAAGSLP